jgi:hypothetical protein
MDFLKELINNNTTEQLAGLNISEKCKKKLILESIIDKDADLLVDLLDKFKFDPQFGNSHREDRNPLILAISESTDEIVDILLTRGVDANLVTPHGSNVVQYAFQLHKDAIALKMIRDGANPDTEKYQAIHHVLARHTNDEVVPFLTEVYRIHFSKLREVKLSQEDLSRLEEIRREINKLLKDVDRHIGNDLANKVLITALIIRSVNLRYV